MARAGGITNAVNVGIAVQADWENREFISHISLNVRRLFDFLVQFGTHFSFSPKLPVTVSFCLSVKPHHHYVLHLIGYPMSVGAQATTKSKLASLNEKLDVLERRLELLEVQVGNASANPSLFAT
ncbi:hypothetical protein LR48_Vigan319s002100 [Vigna angularis]|uniref:Protein BRICK 1 n=1 Tax=Phaseolus angularis TaxID=3914 RepID=A0A0L9T8C6_PHAAN|nr:Protein BRICK 1 [Vigna angularis]KOM26822.1 hypothetical protein LR48_Vigan319s002100 [Vigna angularis]